MLSLCPALFLVLGIYKYTNQTKRLALVELIFWWKETDSKQNISGNV